MTDGAAPTTQHVRDIVARLKREFAHGGQPPLTRFNAGGEKSRLAFRQQPTHDNARRLLARMSHLLAQQALHWDFADACAQRMTRGRIQSVEGLTAGQMAMLNASLKKRGDAAA